MNTLIHNKLSQLEQEYNITILYACESGSRAWGFPSPDSDYDVRFIFVRRMNDYLAIDEKSDNIVLPIDENLLDFSGWEIRKTLRLMARSNVSPFEWTQSPMVYWDKHDFLAQLKDLAPSYYIAKPAMAHYIGLTKKTFKTALQAEQVKLKKYFYALRPILCAKWIMEYDTIPPLEFDQLLPLVASEPDVLKAIQHLLHIKETADESETIAPVPLLHDFVEREMESCSRYRQDLPARQNNLGLLNELFREMLLCNG